MNAMQQCSMEKSPPSVVDCLAAVAFFLGLAFLLESSKGSLSEEKIGESGGCSYSDWGWLSESA
jgi:hypothetical protein